MLFLRSLLYFLALSTIIATLSGSASAIFLLALDKVTHLREADPRWYLFLPLAGLLIGLCYHYLGDISERGNNLLIEEVHTPQGQVPFRMAPLVLLATLLTHLVGGSAGREGTAVQMGGSLAFQVARWLKVKGTLRRDILLSGIAGGFASVFGTPLAGAVFALEVIIVGRIRHDALLPTVLTALMANQICHWWGIQHTPYPSLASLPLDAISFLALLVAALLFGLTARIFASTVHFFQKIFQYISWPPLRPLVAGCLLLVFFALWPQAKVFAGLGIEEIVASFSQVRPAWFFGLKLFLTAFTLGGGFKGGEVTPLFFIGAGLGSFLAGILPIPLELLVACGFVAVFGAATNTPIASTIMGMELFGSEVGIALALTNVVAYLASGHSGIYVTQIIGSPKLAEKSYLKGKKLR